MFDNLADTNKYMSYHEIVDIVTKCNSLDEFKLQFALSEMAYDFRLNGWLLEAIDELEYDSKFNPSIKERALSRKQADILKEYSRLKLVS